MPEGWQPERSHRPEAFFYFSVVTLTTLGFGDITAVSPTSRELVMFEALIGQLYPAIIIARLVTLELHTRQQDAGAPVSPRLPAGPPPAGETSPTSQAADQHATRPADN
jgi:hypothetical protein